MSTILQKHGFHLSKDQAKKLAKGERIRIKHADLHGPQHVYLTKSQLNKVHKHIKDRTGMTLHLSQRQIKHAIKHGSGIFGDLIKKAVGAIAPIALDGLSGLAKNKIASMTGNGIRKKRRGKGLLGNLLKKAVGAIAPIALDGLSGLAKDKIASATSGSGINTFFGSGKRVGRKRKQGGSFIPAGY